jgi:hypothetical protein
LEEQINHEKDEEQRKEALRDSNPIVPSRNARRGLSRRIHSGISRAKRP